MNRLSLTGWLLLGLLPVRTPAAEDPGEKLGPRLTGWAYSTTARPLADRFADPGNRLNDGKVGRNAPLAIWRGSTVIIDLNLNGRCRLTAIRIHQHRHNLNYKLDHLSVLIRQAGQWVEKARRQGFFGPTPVMDFTHTVPLANVETDAVRLQFVGVGVLSLSEVELFGARMEETGPSRGPFATIPFQTTASPVARQADLDGNGQPEVILENRYVRLILTPAQGGVCRSFRYKPTGAELVYARDSGYGLLRDQLWKPHYSFGDRVYFHRLANTTDHASVELWTTGVGGMMGFTEIRKRLTLTKGSPVVHVHYALTNDPSSQTDYEYGFWQHNWLGEAGATNTYFFPTTEGVKSFTLDGAAARKSGETWYRNPARGWTAVVSAKGTGLALTMPYKYLNLFYYWHGAGGVAATHEWRFNLLSVKPGGKLEWNYTLIPFANVRRVDGVVSECVGELDASVHNGRLRAQARLVAPPGTAKLQAELSVHRPDGSNKVLGRFSVSGRGTAQTRATLPAKATGLYVVQLSIKRKGKLVGVFERPVRVGQVQVAYRLKPEGPRVGKTEVPSVVKPGHEISTAVVTPHVPWAKPFAGGKIRALVLMDDMNCREAVELAERIELDLDYVKFRTTFAKELLYQGDQSILTLDAARKALLHRLKTRRYDVLLLAGFKWDFHFTSEIRRTIVALVRRGTGLVLIQPDGFDKKTAAMLPVAGVAKDGSAGRNLNRWHRWKSGGGDPLVEGLDWTLFPRTRRHEYTVPPRGRVVATFDDGAPLLTLGRCGKGRVVSATWDTLTHDLGYRGYSALTPILSYRGGWLRPEFASLPRGYQEWWFALLTRMTAWAAGRDTGVTISGQVPLPARGPARLRLAIHSQQALPRARVELYWFNAIGLRTGPLYRAVDVKKGKTVVAFPVPNPPVVTPGTNAVCYILRRSDGASVAWGFAGYKHPDALRLVKAAVHPDTLLPAGGVWQQDTPVETRVFRAGGNVTLTVTLGARANSTPLTLNIAGTDTFGREVLRVKAAVPAGTDTLRVPLTLPPLVAQGLELQVLLTDGKVVHDQKLVRLVAYRPRVWNRFWYTSWGGQYLWRTKYLFDFNNKLVRDWGVDVSFWGTNELQTGKVRDNAFWGINHSWLGLLSYMGKGVPDFVDHDFAKKAAGYAKTGDKEYLKRTPCLVDPAWRAAVRKSLLDRVTKTMPPGTYDYCMGDEMSLTHYTRFLDFDWSDASLRDFRRRLKGKYPALAVLNAAWSTQYERWDEVVPLTREEARKAKNPAPWFEFRTYMNHQLADFFAFVQKTIRSVDPHARCGLSGTQSPEAANGMDWWLLAKAFSYYHSYNTSQSCEMRRSFQQVGGADQSPYFSGYSATDPGAEHRMWWCLFHDTRGISAWKTGLFWYGDFTETQSGRDTKRHLDAFKSGIWRLVRGAKRQHDGIAIYYSMPSILAAALTGDEQRLNAARDAWVKLIEDCGLQYEFVAYQQVADGFLRNGDFKVVVLPYTLALSRQEADELRAFVRRGGTLIATRLAGVRDELGRVQRPPWLADLFGVRVAGKAEAVEPVVRLAQAAAGLPAGTELRLPVALSNLSLTGGRAGAEAGKGVPVFISGANGHALLLNLDLTHFEQERRFHSATEKRLEAFVLAFLARAGVKPKYPVTLKSGRASQVEVVRYQAPGVEYLCLLNAAGDADTATIPLGRKRYVYDVRAGAFREAADRLTVPLDPQCARLYCLTARALPAPEISAPGLASRVVGGSRNQAGGTLRFTVRRTAPSSVRQLIRLTVTDAAGRRRRELQQTLWVQNTPVSSSFPLALNDPTGKWTLTATDVISGQRAATNVTVH